MRPTLRFIESPAGLSRRVASTVLLGGFCISPDIVHSTFMWLKRPKNAARGVRSVRNLSKIPYSVRFLMGHNAEIRGI
jgi:hypothetical protein